MAIQSFRSKRSAPALRLAALLGVAACVIALHPVAFTVKGVWDTPVSDVKQFPTGFGPDSVAGMVLSENISSGGEVSLILKDRLGVGYKSGPVSGSWDDTNAWEANYTTDDTALVLSGIGAEPFSWEARKAASVEGVGDVQVNVSKSDGFGVSVSRDLPEVMGLALKGYAQARNDVLSARLLGQRSYGTDGVALYSVEMPEGSYDIENWTYKLSMTDTVQDGTLTTKLAREQSEVSYNVTYEHELDKLFKGDADATLGLDVDGFYGRLQTSHSLGKGVQADVVATGKTDTSFKTGSYTSNMKLSHDLGSLTLAKASDEAVKVSAASTLDVAGMTLSGSANTTLEEDAEIKYNVTLSKDLSDALAKLESSGSLVIGSDAASEDGLYGLLEAGRGLGKGFMAQLSLAARGRSVTPALKVSNQFGYAKLSKPSDSAPRVTVGYEFSA
eukprot:CAMPEP_0178399342 /NCGR_PEP_ID=MMETSP0689_2-20121128/15232_1 /TAXON_ID=160604 /ORGANISM="Amphidinium massartii, Strain CS-259" /LENGTH=443 /DNA_ID=CAMNT_0020020119 /DNA_START=96 /DNA_END=1427 /DNA_ORIENTATION=+